MAAQRERFSTTTRLRILGEQAAARVYRAQSRRLRRPPRRTRFTGRAALLALVVCGLVVALAYPLRQYAAQRADIAEERRELEETRERVEQLRDEKARWQDPAYVEQQARKRLQYVRPGETSLLLTPEQDSDGERDGEENDAAPDAEGADEEAARREAARRDDLDAASRRPWYDNLWDSIDQADRADQTDRTDQTDRAAER